MTRILCTAIIALGLGAPAIAQPVSGDDISGDYDPDTRTATGEVSTPGGVTVSGEVSPGGATVKVER